MYLAIQFSNLQQNGPTLKNKTSCYQKFKKKLVFIAIITVLAFENGYFPENRPKINSEVLVKNSTKIYIS